MLDFILWYCLILNMFALVMQMLDKKPAVRAMSTLLYAPIVFLQMSYMFF